MSTLYRSLALSFFCLSTAAAANNCENLADSTASFRTTLDQNGVLELPAGQTFKIAGLELKDNEKIIGPGTLCKAATSAAGILITGTNTSVSNVSFRPTTTSGQPNCDIKLGEGVTNSKIINNDFDGQIYSAVCAANDTAVGGSAYTTPVAGLMLSDNTFNGYVRPVYLHSVDNFTIQDNIIQHSLRDAVRLRENDGYGLITGNQFVKIGNGVNSTDTQDAIDTYWGGNRLVISNNIVRTTESMGFDIKGVSPFSAAEGSRSIIIANNHISDTRHSGIVLHGNLDTGESNYSITINSNIVESVTRVKSYSEAAIWAKGAISYLTISNNQLRQNFARGITVQTRTGANDGSVKGVHITGNTLINNGVDTAASSIGIYMQGVDGAIVTGNTVGNDYDLPNAHSRFGIYATNISNGIYKNNILRCNAISQLTVAGSNIVKSDNLTVTTNCQ